MEGWQVDKGSERKSVNKNVVEWIKNRAESEFGADISMVLIYGSFVNGTANETSDVDCYFIPKTPKGYHMGCTFIIRNTGYDIFPMSWDRVQRISELREGLLPLVGDAEMIYCHSAEDKLKFECFRKNMYENLNNVEYRNSIIRERFAKVCDADWELERCCDPVKIRKTAGNIIMMLADLIALYHGDYFHYGLKKQYDDLCTKFKDAPEGFAEEYDQVIKSFQDEEYKMHCRKLLALASEHIGLPIAMKEEVIVEAVPGKAEFKESTPEKTEPEESTLEKIKPEESMSEKTKLEESIPRKSEPEEFMTEKLMLEESVPEKTVSEEEMHGKTMPEAAQGEKEIRTDYGWLAGLYEEICSTFQKIYFCCKSGNASLAFLSAVCLQRDLDDAIAYGGSVYDLLSSYRYDRLEKLAQRAEEIERDYVSLLEQAGVKLRKYDSFEEFALQFALA